MDTASRRLYHVQEQCETVRHIGETLGDKIGDTDWTEICRATLLAAQRCVTEKGELNVMVSSQVCVLCFGSYISLLVI